jgi:predicted nucleic acid-binding Zn ribbon protein
MMTSRREDDPMPLGRSIDRVVRSLQGATAPEAGAMRALGGVFGRWEEIVGPAVAAHVRPIRLDRARLVVEVGDPAWATQIRLLSDRVRQRVAEVTGTAVETLEVRVARRHRTDQGAHHPTDT